MILVFLVPQPAGGSDYVISIEYGPELLRKILKKMESPCTGELDRFFVKWENLNYRSNFAVSVLSIFKIFLSLYHTLSISDSRCPLTGIIKITESPLVWNITVKIDNKETVERMSAASSSDKFVEIYKQTLDDVAIWKATS